MKPVIVSSIEIPDGILPVTAAPSNATGTSAIGKPKKSKSKKHSKLASGIDVPAIVTEYASAPVTIGGQTEELARVQIRRTFALAIKGNTQALKTVLAWVDKYVPKPEPTPVQKVLPASFELTQDDVDFWKKNGCLPADCPSQIQDIPLSLLNHAVQKSQKSGHKNRPKIVPPANPSPISVA